MKKFFVFFFSVFLFSGCSGIEKLQNFSESTPVPSSHSAIVEKIEAERVLQNQKQGVFLELSMREAKGSLFAVDVILKNEQALPISSVQSWVVFPKEILRARQVVLPKDSIFSLVAPGENTFDEENGLAKIGVSVPEGKNFVEKQTIIASLIFERKKESPILLDFYDFGNDGKTRIFAITQNGIRNVLLKANLKNLKVE